MDYEQLLYEVDGGVATLTLNRPDQRNALSGQLLSELVDGVKTARDDEDVRAVVLTGAGEKVFCAGADLGGFAADAPPGLALSCDLVIAKEGATFGAVPLSPRAPST